jgi:hypothetical protein
VIEEYLERLDRELRALRAPRRRLLAEAEDHLRASAEDLGDEAEAVRRFGDARTVATRFAEAAAKSGARRSTVILGIAFAVYAAAFAAFWATASQEFADFPQGAPSQLALVAAAAAVAFGVLGERRRTEALLAGAAALSAGAALELVVALTRPAGILPWQDLPLTVALFALAAAGAGAAAVSTAISRIQEKNLQRNP